MSDKKSRGGGGGALGGRLRGTLGDVEGLLGDFGRASGSRRGHSGDTLGSFCSQSEAHWYSDGSHEFPTYLRKRSQINLSNGELGGNQCEQR